PPDKPIDRQHCAQGDGRPAGRAGRKESNAEGGAGAQEDQHACKSAHDAPRRRSCGELPDVRDERRHHEKRGSLHWWHRKPERTHRDSWEAHAYHTLRQPPRRKTPTIIAMDSVGIW